MIMSIMKWVFMRITQASERLLNSSAVPLPLPFLARKIPLSERPPNLIQTIDIHTIIDVESGLFRGSNKFFPLSAASGRMLRQVSERGLDDFVRAPPLV